MSKTKIFMTPGDETSDEELEKLVDELAADEKKKEPPPVRKTDKK